MKNLQQRISSSNKTTRKATSGRKQMINDLSVFFMILIIGATLSAFVAFIIAGVLVCFWYLLKWIFRWN